jgi:hypothetical protein
VVSVGFADRIRAWFKGETKGSRKAPSQSTSKANRASTRELEEFISSRPGVEGFVEPATTIYPMTLLLVAADGEYLRRPVRDRDQAGEVCTRAQIPMYDAAKVGYPRRMRDYDRGIKRDSVSLEELPPWPGEDAGGESA